MTESQHFVELTPGSPAAGKAGCTCPVMDNNHGKGFMRPPSGQPMFYMSSDCPLHGERKKKNEQSDSQ